jgi:hypothetical protein
MKQIMKTNTLDLVQPEELAIRINNSVTDWQVAKTLAREAVARHTSLSTFMCLSWQPS